jgi:uncharacterized protein involved in exopolysaccharide biosynthesis
MPDSLPDAGPGPTGAPASTAGAETAGADSMALLIALAERWRLLVVGPLLIGVAALGLSYLITPTFTARTSFLPPQPPQSAAAVGLASLGALSGLVGGSAALRTPADQYVALAQSMTVVDRIIDQFELLKVYDRELRFDARKVLARNTRISAGKRDGIIVVEVDDDSPARAADMANRYVEELRVLTSRLALTEAQQRRVFFEGHLQRTRERLTLAQTALQASGFDQASLKAEPKAAAEGYAKLKAEVTTGQARLQTLRSMLTDRAPEVQQAEAALGVLGAQLARVEQSATQGTAPDYIGRYREFKYQEALFEQFSRQYELARVDESREGTLQVVDLATPPEKKSAPARSLIAVGATVAGLILLLGYVLTSHHWRQAAQQPQGARQRERLRAALRRR